MNQSVSPWPSGVDVRLGAPQNLLIRASGSTSIRRHSAGWEIAVTRDCVHCALGGASDCKLCLTNARRPVYVATSQMRRFGCGMECLGVMLGEMSGMFLSA